MRESAGSSRPNNQRHQDATFSDHETNKACMRIGKLLEGPGPALASLAARDGGDDLVFLRFGIKRRAIDDVLPVDEL